MKKIFTVGALLLVVLLSKPTRPADAMALESCAQIPGGPWDLVDSEEMQQQSALILETMVLLQQAQEGHKLDSTAYQKAATAWHALAQVVGSDLSYEAFQRGFAGNYSRCQFTSVPPLHLCLGLESPIQLQEQAGAASPATTICEAIQQFEQKTDQEKNLHHLRATLVPLYQRLVAEKRGAPFKDFGTSENFGVVEFEGFFTSIEALEAAQARRGAHFRPLDRFGQILRQSSIFAQNKADLELAIAATRGQTEFETLLEEQRALWNAARVLPDTPKNLGDILNQLSMNITSRQQDTNQELAQVGLALLQGGKKSAFWVTDQLCQILPALAALFSQQTPA